MRAKGRRGGAYSDVETLQVVQIEPFERSKWYMRHHLDGCDMGMVVGRIVVSAAEGASFEASAKTAGEVRGSLRFC